MVITYFFYFILLSNLIGYIFLFVFKASVLVSILTIFLAFFLSYFLTKHHLLFKTDILKNKLLFLPFFVLLIATMFVVSPIIKTQTIDSYPFVFFPSVTDYFKHMYTITSIKSFGIPPLHPYLPQLNMTYYYGYYILPSLVSIIFPHLQNYILYIYVFFTSLLSLLIIFNLYKHFIKSNLLLFISFCLISFGTGLDIIPTKITNKIGTGKLIELWSIKPDLGLRIDNTFTSFLWTPQHFFSAVIACYCIFNLLENKNKSWLNVLCLSFVFLSSSFVFIPLLIFIGLFFLFNSRKRIYIIKNLFLTFLFCSPFIFTTLFQKTSTFSFFTPKSYYFTSVKFLNYLFTFIAEYGSLIILLPIFLFAQKKPKNILQLITVWSLLNIFLTWIIRSANYNDYALRSTLLIQLFFPVSLSYYLKSISKNKQRIVYSLLVINLCFSLLGFFYEYYYRWKERSSLDVHQSQLITYLRTFKPSTSVLGEGEWAYKIPPLAFKPIYSSEFYDSANYLGVSKNDYQGLYTNLSKDIFFTQNVSNNQATQILQKNNQLSSLKQYFSLLKTEYLLLNNKIYVRQDINPWYEIFSHMLNIDSISVDQYSLYKVNDLRQFFNSNVLSIDSISNSLQIKDFHKLPVGTFYLYTCNNSDADQYIHFEPDNQYVLFDSTLTPHQCIGNLYVNTDNSKLTIDPYWQDQTLYFHRLKNSSLQS